MTYRFLLSDLLAKETTKGYTDECDMELAKIIVKRLDVEEARKFWLKAVSEMKQGEFQTWCDLVEERGMLVLVTNHTLPPEDLELQYIKFSFLPAASQSEPGLIFVTN